VTALAVLRAESDLEKALSYFQLGTGVFDSSTGREVVTKKSSRNKCIEVKSVTRNAETIAGFFKQMKHSMENGGDIVKGQPPSDWTVPKLQARIGANTVERVVGPTDVRRVGVLKARVRWTSTWTPRPVPSISRATEEHMVVKPPLYRRVSAVHEAEFEFSSQQCLPYVISTNVTSVNVTLDENAIHDSLSSELTEAVKVLQSDTAAPASKWDAAYVLFNEHLKTLSAISEEARRRVLEDQKRQALLSAGVDPEQIRKLRERQEQQRQQQKASREQQLEAHRQRLQQELETAAKQQQQQQQQQQHQDSTSQTSDRSEL